MGPAGNTDNKDILGRRKSVVLIDGQGALSGFRRRGYGAGDQKSNGVEREERKGVDFLVWKVKEGVLMSNALFFHCGRVTS